MRRVYHEDSFHHYHLSVFVFPEPLSRYFEHRPLFCLPRAGEIVPIISGFRLLFLFSIAQLLISLFRDCTTLQRIEISYLKKDRLYNNRNVIIVISIIRAIFKI